MELSINDGHGLDNTAIFAEFKRRHGIGHILAFSGGADDSDAVISNQLKITSLFIHTRSAIQRHEMLLLPE